MDTILIGIAGGTGSGKTTLADKLVESFGRDEVSILRHDNYYKRHDDILQIPAHLTTHSAKS